VTTGRVSLKLSSGQPAVISLRTDLGRTYLLGFCLQDTYFQTYRDADSPSRNQLYRLIEDLLRDAKVRPHIHSTSPDIEASLRANSTEGYVFVINHEESQPHTTIHLADLSFRVRHITDVETGEPITFSSTRGGVVFPVTAAFGSTRLLRISP
jgi:hypothetical protein